MNQGVLFTERDGIFICALCGEQFTFEGGVRVHITCLHPFASNSWLARRNRYRPNIPTERYHPNTSNGCTSRNRKRHGEVEKPFECAICTKSFSSEKRLKMHGNAHYLKFDFTNSHKVRENRGECLGSQPSSERGVVAQCQMEEKVELGNQGGEQCGPSIEEEVHKSHTWSHAEENTANTERVDIIDMESNADLLPIQQELAESPTLNHDAEEVIEMDVDSLINEELVELYTWSHAEENTANTERVDITDMESNADLLPIQQELAESHTLNPDVEEVIVMDVDLVIKEEPAESYTWSHAEENTANTERNEVDLISIKQEPAESHTMSHEEGEIVNPERNDVDLVSIKQEPAEAHTWSYAEEEIANTERVDITVMESNADLLPIKRERAESHPLNHGEAEEIIVCSIEQEPAESYTWSHAEENTANTERVDITDMESNAHLLPIQEEPAESHSMSHKEGEIVNTERNEVDSISIKQEPAELQEVESQLKEQRAGELQTETEQLKEQAARQNAIITSLRNRVQELEERERTLNNALTRTEMSVETLSRENRYQTEKIKEIELKMNHLEMERSTEEQNKKDTQRNMIEVVNRLASTIGAEPADCSGVEAVTHKAYELIQDVSLLRSKNHNLTDTLSSVESELQSCRDQLSRTVVERDNLERLTTSHLLEIERIKELYTWSDAEENTANAERVHITDMESNADLLPIKQELAESHTWSHVEENTANTERVDITDMERNADLLPIEQEPAESHTWSHAEEEIANTERVDITDMERNSDLLPIKQEPAESRTLDHADEVIEMDVDLVIKEEPAEIEDEPPCHSNNAPLPVEELRGFEGIEAEFEPWPVGCECCDKKFESSADVQYHKDNPRKILFCCGLCNIYFVDCEKAEFHSDMHILHTEIDID